MSQTITAVYDSRSDAERAVEKLVAAGISRSSTRIVAGSETPSTTSYDYDRDDRGFWATLKDMFTGEDDRSTYTESLNRGGTLLTATVEDAHVDAAMDIMEEHGSVDLDERETTWRNEGWSGRSASVASAGALGTGADPASALKGNLRDGEVVSRADEDAAGTSAQGASGAGLSGAGMPGTASVAGAGTASRRLDADTSETIPVVEERLQVGKRRVDNGRVRLRSYVTETPVNEQVTLHDEHVHVDRRTVDRPVTAGDQGLFAERTIEASAHSEQAMVNKDARVVGEVGLRKEGDTRTETVSDTVRRTEVEVKDERGEISRTGTTDAPRR